MRWGALLVAAAALSGCTAASSPGASCAAPFVELSVTTASPGDDVTVTGGAFLTDCYDQGEGGTPPPYQDIAISLAPVATPESGLPLGDADADAEGGFELTVRIPDDMALGPAQLTAGTATAGIDVIPR
jgi:hypothetical protein